MDKVIAFPNQLNTTKTDIKQQSGLFAEIGYYWIVKENKLYLWSFMKKHDLSIPEEFSQQITHVLLAKTMPNVFAAEVTVFSFHKTNFTASPRNYNSNWDSSLSFEL